MILARQTLEAISTGGHDACIAKHINNNRHHHQALAALPSLGSPITINTALDVSILSLAVARALVTRRPLRGQER